MNEFFRRTVLLLGSLAVACAVSEVYLRWNPPSDVYMITRNIVQQTHSEPSDDPVLGYLPRAGLEKSFRNREFNTTVKINSRHMRDREYPYAKPPGIKRIVAVGDSFVFGWGVEGEETVTELLEEKYLERTEVLNMGISGYCADGELEWLRTEGVKYQPDTVLFFLYGYPERCFNEYQFEDEKLYWKSAERESLIREWNWYLYRHFYLYTLLKESYHHLKELLLGKVQRTALSSEEREVFFKEGLDVLSELETLQKEKGFDVTFVFIPMKEELERGLDAEAEKGVGILDRFASERGWGFTNLLPPLKKHQEKTGRSPYFKYDDHWNRDGHRAAAESIVSFLRISNGLEESRFRAKGGS